MMPVKADRQLSHQAASLRRASARLTPASQQLIERRDDHVTLFSQCINPLAQVLSGDGDDFQRVQYDRLALDSEGRIETGVDDLAERRSVYQGHYDPTPVLVIQGRLHNNDKWNAIAVASRVPMNVKLRHLQGGMVVGE